MRRRVIGELMAPVISAILWNIAMRNAVEPQSDELNDAVKDFHAPFAGPGEPGA